MKNSKLKKVLDVLNVLDDLLIELENEENFCRIPIYVKALPEAVARKDPKLKGLDSVYYTENLFVPDEISLINSGQSYSIVSLIMDGKYISLERPNKIINEIQFPFAGIERANRLRAHPKKIKDNYSLSDYVTKFKVYDLIDEDLNRFINFRISDDKNFNSDLIEKNFRKNKKYYDELISHKF